MDKQALLAQIRATHEPIAVAVGDLSDDAWADPIPDMGGWTRKDALAHLGWWSDHSVRVITALRAGEVPYERNPDFDINAQNRSILEEFRERDAGDVRAYEAAAFLTSSTIRCSFAGVRLVSAKATGHICSSSSRASGWKPRVE